MLKSCIVKTILGLPHSRLRTKLKCIKTWEHQNTNKSNGTRTRTEIDRATFVKIKDFCATKTLTYNLEEECCVVIFSRFIIQSEMKEK